MLSHMILRSVILITLPLSILLSRPFFAYGQDNCNCSACESSDRVYVGLHEDLVSPSCPEGSVATVEGLHSTDDNNGGYLVETSNAESFFFDNPYVYRQASFEDDDVTCFEFDPTILPVIGDQSDIQVTLNCEAFTFCDFRWNVQFGCMTTGVTFDSANGGYQVLSDVDDTITCSNPSTTCDSIASCTVEGTVTEFLSGVDRRLEHHEMYPGVAELQLGLALGPNDGDNGSYIPAKPLILSARPREAEFFLAIDQDSELNIYFESVGDNSNYPSWGVNVDSSMYGSIFDGTDYTEIGQTKARSYLSLVEENPNTRFVFLGDNGQGDVCAAQSMLESSSDGRQQLAAVLIHLVQEDPSKVTTDCQAPDGAGTDFTLDLPESDTVHYFRTHSNATVWCLEKELISCNSAANVYNAIDEWYSCRCNGECPSGDLITGISTQATREETLNYCNHVENDQVFLAEAIAACNNPTATEVPSETTTATSSSSRRWFVSGMIYYIALCAARVVGPLIAI